jgi:hypothetical protein
VNFGSMSTGNPREPVEHLLHFGTDDAEALEHVLRLGVVPLGLQRHDLARQRRDRVADLRAVHGEGAVLLHLERAGVEQVIHLDRDAAAVRLVDAEADRSERRREERRVHRPGDRRIELLLVGELAKRPQARDVRLRFLDRAVGFLQLLPHRRLPPADGDVVRAETVHQLVHQDVREEGVERDSGLVAAGSAILEIGSSTILNFASCMFFSITRLVPFSLTTRSSFGRL